MLQGKHSANFRPSLNYDLSLRYLFCLFLSGCFTQVLLYLMSESKGDPLFTILNPQDRKVRVTGTFKAHY